MKPKAKSRFYAVGVSAAIALMASSAANALVISGSSSAFGLDADVSVIDLVTIDVGPLPSGVSGTAPPAYNISDTTQSVNEGNAFLSMSTDVMNAHAESNVDGNPGPRSASANASVDNLGLGTLLSTILSAATITSNASVTGNFGALTAMGGSVVEDLTVLGAVISGSVTASAAPNTEILPLLLNPLGLSLILNEQILTGDASTSLALTVNALHLSFDDFSLLGALGVSLGLLNGDIILAQSQAELGATADLTAVAAPPALVLFGIGLFVIGIGLARRNQKGDDPRMA